MSDVTMVNSHAEKDSRTFTFAGADAATIAERVALFMTERGYRLESGDKSAGVWGRGSSVGHAILGMLGGRMKLNVAVGAHGENVKVVISRGMGGWWGGLLAASRVRRKFEDLTSALPEAVLST
jgi:hypothetical protein